MYCIEAKLKFEILKANLQKIGDELDDAVGKVRALKAEFEIALKEMKEFSSNEKK